MSTTIEPLTGIELTRALPDLARLRITVFREWPYLYDGTLDYEQNYLAKFANADGALIVTVRDDDHVVGMATATPLLGHADAFVDALTERGFEPANIFYFGESMLLPAYRGRGIGHAFFDQREAHARRFGPYTHTAFCAVVRPDDHRLRPADYRPLDGFWRKRGYDRLEGCVARFEWKDVDQEGETAKPMQFWIREI